MRHFAGLALFACLYATHSFGAAANVPLNIVITCRANPQCIFDGEDIYLAVAIENPTDRDVFLTTKFMRGTGADIKIIDIETNKTHFSFASLGDYTLLRDFQLVPAKGRVDLKTEILSAQDLTLQRESSVYLRLEVTYLGRWKLSNGAATPFDRVGHVHIISADTLARRQLQK